MIVLSPPSKRAVRRAISSGADTPVCWAYLGSSIRTKRQVMQWLESDAERIDVATMLQQSAETFRRPYIDYIGRLGDEKKSAGWWFGSLSEKNPGVSSVFQRLCYVSVAARLAHQHGHAGVLVLVVENREVRAVIEGDFLEKGKRVEMSQEPCRNFVIGAVCDWGEMLIRRIWGIGRQIYRMIVARMLGFSAQVFNGATTHMRPWVALHDWIDTQSFEADGRYRGNLFGPLCVKLQQRGLPVVIVAAVLHKKAPFVRLLRQLRRSGLPVLIPQAALSLGTILRWGRSLLVRPPQPRGWPRFEGIDVSAILNENERMDWKHTRVGEVFLIADVVRAWRRHFDICAFIYTYEGHTWERGYCLAMREQFPQAKIVGYQHSTIPPMHLSNFISRSEWGHVPFPDRVVTNGRHHYELLRQNEIPERILSCGGAFRYSTLEHDASSPVTGRSGQSVVSVLAAFSIFPAQAGELLLAVREAFQDSDKFLVLLKFHPLLPAFRVAAEAGSTLRSLPAHIQVVEKPLSQLLPDTSVLVYTDTTAAVEALAYGVPVVHLQPSHAIDMDRLGQFEGARVSVETTAGLREAVQSVLKANAKVRAARAKRWREIAHLLLPKPDESMVDLFVPDRAALEHTEAERVATEAR